MVENHKYDKKFYVKYFCMSKSTKMKTKKNSRLCFHYNSYVEFCHDYVFHVCGKLTYTSEQSSQGG
jgi:hypothetical protein